MKYDLKKDLLKSAKLIFTSFLLLFCALGIIFSAMIFVNPRYIMMPLVAVSNNQYTKMAGEYHSEVQEIANNITKTCNESNDVEFCYLREAREFMINNFEYEYDWAFGYFEGQETINMILDWKSKGDCVDFSVTFCSLMNHLNMSCLVRSPNGGHRIAIVRISDMWIPLDPQNYDTGFFDSETFQGFLI